MELFDVNINVSSSMLIPKLIVLREDRERGVYLKERVVLAGDA